MSSTMTGSPLSVVWTRIWTPILPPSTGSTFFAALAARSSSLTMILRLLCRLSMTNGLAHLNRLPGPSFCFFGPFTPIFGSSEGGFRGKSGKPRFRPQDDQHIKHNDPDTQSHHPKLQMEDPQCLKREPTPLDYPKNQFLDHKREDPLSMPTETPNQSNVVPTLPPPDPPSLPLLRREKRQRKLNPKYFGNDFINFTSTSSPHGLYTIQRAIEELTRKEPKLDQHLEYLQTLNWDTSAAALSISSKLLQAKRFANLSLYEDPVSGILDSHPLILSTKTEDVDISRWHQTTSSENTKGFWKAMWAEIVTLQDKEAWIQVPRASVTQKIVKTTWAFKVKWFPSGLVRKMKARFYVRGDTQTARESIILNPLLPSYPGPLCAFSSSCRSCLTLRPPKWITSPPLSGTY